VDQADVQLKVAFPGDVLDSDGQVDGTQVSWVFTPGQVNDFHAIAGSPDPAAPSVLGWSLAVAVIVGITAVMVVARARAQRNPPSALATLRDPSSSDPSAGPVNREP
jgi:hypothetical protein